MTSAYDFIAIDNHKEEIKHLSFPLLKKAHRLVTSYVFFHLGALVAAGIEVALFLSFFALLGKSTVLAFLLALFLLTVFTFFVARLYLQARKKEQLIFFCEEFLEHCKKSMRYQEGLPDHHMILSTYAQRLAKDFHEKEYYFYTPPDFLKSLSKTMEKFSAFCHWKEMHEMKEFLLEYAVEEQIKAIKCKPTNLEFHAALAHSYVMLSSLYANPAKYDGYDPEKYIPHEKITDEMQAKFRKIASKAIEEFKILNEYAPEDPWVHIQLAYSYHDLQMPEEEIKEYEIVMKLLPDDKETFFKLGMLYFQQGKNANGLRIYEELKKNHHHQADNLIKFYGGISG